MSEYIIEKYNGSRRKEWDEFVKNSRNATFLLQRGYMDYHSSRFKDCSWMVWKKGRLMALLPANLTEDGVLHSHQGLTYGGWLLPPAHLDGADLLEIFRNAIAQWKNCGITELDYKPIPDIYHRQPSQEDEYILWRLGAQLQESTLDAAVNLRRGVHFNTLQRRHLSKGRRSGAVVGETHDVESFHAMLTQCLSERHGVKPVHSADELKLLMDRFPGNIRLFTVRETSESEFPEAGVCIYDTGIVAHAQYIASTPKAREQGLLSLLFDYLMTSEYADREYFDFGISTEDGGRIINEGLLRQKYSLGATGVACRRWRLKL